MTLRENKKHKICSLEGENEGPSAKWKVIYDKTNDTLEIDCDGEYTLRLTEKSAKELTIMLNGIVWNRLFRKRLKEWYEGDE